MSSLCLFVSEYLCPLQDREEDEVRAFQCKNHPRLQSEEEPKKYASKELKNYFATGAVNHAKN